MPTCGCKRGKCTSCICAKSGSFCTPACHGHADNLQCMCWDGSVFDPNPKEMKPPALRKTLAQSGLSPMGDRDELIRRLRDHLIAQGQGHRAGDGSAPHSTAPPAANAPAGMTSKALIAKVLEHAGDYGAVLSLGARAGTPTITKDSPTKVMRAAYLKLSVKIHPDKNAQSTDSKAAFQALVTAYERLSQPELFVGEDETDSSGKGKGKNAKPKKISRSNAGCFVTRSYCPRCHMEWNKAELGLETGAYNWFMMGIKEFSCGRCLCEFGCMTATHRCPFCRKPFEYHPNDYHRMIMCGNEGCSKRFGFVLQHVSERRENEVRREIKALHERRMREQSQKGGRAARAAARRAAESATAGAGVGGAATKATSKQLASRRARTAAGGAALTEEEIAFAKGLVDKCPRCGGDALTLCRGKYSEERALQHLRCCTDASVHAKHAKRVAEQQAREAAKAQGQNRQHDMMVLKQWEFNGAKPGQLWMLSEHSLREQCELRAVPTEGASTKAELITRLAPALRRRDEGRFLTDGSGADMEGGVPAQKRRRMMSSAAEAVSLSSAEADDLPTNLWSMSADELLAVAASYGVKCRDGAVKTDIIVALERARHKNEPLLLMGADTAEQDEEAEASTKKAKAKAVAKAKARLLAKAEAKAIPAQSQAPQPPAQTAKTAVKGKRLKRPTIKFSSSSSSSDDSDDDLSLSALLQRKRQRQNN